MKNILAAAVLAVLTLSSQPAFAGPAVTTEWIEARLSLEDCKDRVVSAINAAGVRDVEPKRYTVFAHSNDYTVAVRCMPDQGVIFFIVSGARLQQADKLLDDVLGAFRR